MKVSTKTSSCKVVIYENNNNLYAFNTQLFRCYDEDGDEYDSDKIPNSMKSKVIKDYLGVTDYTPDLNIDGTILFFKDGNYLADTFFSDKDEVEATKDFIHVISKYQE